MESILSQYGMPASFVIFLLLLICKCFLTVRLTLESQIEKAERASNEAEIMLREQLNAEQLRAERVHIEVVQGLSKLSGYRVISHDADNSTLNKVIDDALKLSSGIPITRGSNINDGSVRLLVRKHCAYCGTQAQWADSLDCRKCGGPLYDQ